jgi:hypothetical protein
MSKETNGSPAREKQGDTADSGSKETRGLWGRLKAAIPPWLGETLRSPRAWKTFTRCMVAFLVSMVLLVDDKSKWGGLYLKPSRLTIALRFMGQAGFFGLIVC